jgi:hypothetical protein
VKTWRFRGRDAPLYLTTYTQERLPPPDDAKMGFFLDFLSSNEMIWQTARSLRIVKTSCAADWKKLPPDFASEMSAFIAGRQHLRTFYKEPASLSDTLTQITSLDALGNVPDMVIVPRKGLMRTRPPPANVPRGT